jgi:hypothetical protein
MPCPDDCRRASLIVTPRQAPANCAAAVIDLLRLRRQGALALWRNDHGFVIAAVRPRGFDRPWSPAPSGETEREDGTLLPGEAARAGCNTVGAGSAAGRLAPGRQLECARTKLPSPREWLKR